MISVRPNTTTIYEKLLLCFKILEKGSSDWLAAFEDLGILSGLCQRTHASTINCLPPHQCSACAMESHYITFKLSRGDESVVENCLTEAFRVAEDSPVQATFGLGLVVLFQEADIFLDSKVFKELAKWAYKTTVSFPLRQGHLVLLSHLKVYPMVDHLSMNTSLPLYLDCIEGYLKSSLSEDTSRNTEGRSQLVVGCAYLLGHKILQRCGVDAVVKASSARTWPTLLLKALLNPHLSKARSSVCHALHGINPPSTLLDDLTKVLSRIPNVPLEFSRLVEPGTPELTVLSHVLCSEDSNVALHGAAILSMVFTVCGSYLVKLPWVRCGLQGGPFPVSCLVNVPYPCGHLDETLLNGLQTALDEELKSDKVTHLDFLLRLSCSSMALHKNPPLRMAHYRILRALADIQCELSWLKRGRPLPDGTSHTTSDRWLWRDLDPSGDELPALTYLEPYFKVLPSCNDMELNPLVKAERLSTWIYTLRLCYNAQNKITLCQRWEGSLLGTLVEDSLKCLDDWKPEKGPREYAVAPLVTLLRSFVDSVNDLPLARSFSHHLSAPFSASGVWESSASTLSASGKPFLGLFTVRELQSEAQAALNSVRKKVIFFLEQRKSDDPVVKGLLALSRMGL